jgi:hypothetical protein
LPGSQAFSIEDFCHLTIAVVVQQAIDLSDNRRFVFRIWAMGRGLVSVRLRVAHGDEQQWVIRRPICWFCA